jgi:hypothetical protein
VEANARNQNTPSPVVLRFDRLPSRAYRLSGNFELAPLRIKMADLITAGADVPMEEHLILPYLFKVARGILADSSFWKDPRTRADARNDARTAEESYRILLLGTSPATPNNYVGTPYGM